MEAIRERKRRQGANGVVRREGREGRREGGKDYHCSPYHNHRN